MKKYKGAIFDLDGTLLNTIADIGNSMNTVLKNMGFPTHTLASYQFKVGSGFAVLVERSLPDTVSTAVRKVALEQLIVVYDKNYMIETVPYEGIITLLESLQDNHIQLAIHTNKKDMYAKNLAQHFFPTIQFVDVIGQQEQYQTKPAPDATFSIINNMKLTQNDIIFIGDSDVDMLTGTNAKVDTIGVTWGFRPEDELQAAGATYLANTAKDVQLIILEGGL